jgi:hypothetical protein
MYAVKATKTLRVGREGELEGLDLHEHGTPAYHMEFGQGMTYTTLLGAGSYIPDSSGGSTTKVPTAVSSEPTSSVQEDM